ncbi:MAG: DUF1538 family protein, partial [Spirochaetaceae bacterium]|nr:DUF1538 family protein [Spirochaetaceae bacterium]
MNYLNKAMNEAISSVLPIFAIVLVLSVSIAPLESGVLVLFLFGTLTLIFGMSLFTIGSEISMQPLGDGIGAQIGRSKRLVIPMAICFVLGVMITIAEPDLVVLAEQIPSVPNMVLIVSVGVGVGIFLVISMIRTKLGIPLSRLLIFFYIGVIVLAFFAPADFIPAAFDSGGVTTGPITVPFIMALGAGMAMMSTAKNAHENSFGLVALCSVGPILSVMILSITFQPEPTSSQTELFIAQTSKEAFLTFAHAFPHYAKEVFVALAPIFGCLVLFQIITRSFSKHQMMRIVVGCVYTYLGLVLFLTGANVGFMPAGRLIGAGIAASTKKFLLIP